MDASNSTLVDSGAFDFKLYRYIPSLPAAAVSVAVFAVLTAAHLWRLLRARAYYFSVFALGGLCMYRILHFPVVSYHQLTFPFLSPVQTVGYCGRIWSHFDDEAIGGFVMQAILILVAPALYAASIYMILGRLIRSLRAEDLSLLPVRWVTKIFVCGDIVSFTLQAGGGGVQAAGTLELYEAGEKIIIAGLWVQICFFSFFVATSVLFNYRMTKLPLEDSRRKGIAWQRHLNVLYLTSAIILIRSIFRVVEYLQGNKGYLISHEIFLYIFDTLLMAVVMVVFLVWYIGDLEGRSGFDAEPLHSSEDAIQLHGLKKGVA